MDVIEWIRDERLQLVEVLAESRLRVIDTLSYLANTSPSMLQNVRPVVEEYFQLRENIISMLINLDALEQELELRMI